MEEGGKDPFGEKIREIRDYYKINLTPDYQGNLETDRYNLSIEKEYEQISFRRKNNDGTYTSYLFDGKEKFELFVKTTDQKDLSERKLISIKILDKEAKKLYSFDKAGNDLLLDVYSDYNGKFPFTNSQNDEIESSLLRTNYQNKQSLKIDQRINKDLEPFLLGFGSYRGIKSEVNNIDNLLKNLDEKPREEPKNVSINVKSSAEFNDLLENLNQKLKTEEGTRILEKTPFAIGIPGHIVTCVIEDGKIKIIDQGGLENDYEEILKKKDREYHVMQKPEKINVNIAGTEQPIEIPTFAWCRDFFNIFIEKYRQTASLDQILMFTPDTAGFFDMHPIGHKQLYRKKVENPEESTNKVWLKEQQEKIRLEQQEKIRALENNIAKFNENKVDSLEKFDNIARKAAEFPGENVVVQKAQSDSKYSKGDRINAATELDREIQNSRKKEPETIKQTMERIEKETQETMAEIEKKTQAVMERLYGKAPEQPIKIEDIRLEINHERPQSNLEQLVAKKTSSGKRNKEGNLGFNR